MLKIGARQMGRFPPHKLVSSIDYPEVVMQQTQQLLTI